MSSLSWLDYSEHERRKAMEVIDLFREDETVDELGIGTIRDAFADLFFPGTSTIQTRARYFLFVPWVYRQVESDRRASDEVATFARKLQGRLRDALVAGGEELGVIGYRAGLNVQRLPSSVYWYGLRQWGILRFSGSEYDYHRSLDSYHRRIDGAPVIDQGEPPDAIPSNWDPHLPAPPRNWLNDCRFDLMVGEAEYLIDRIAARWPQSLLSRILHHRRAIPAECQFAWEYPAVSRYGSEITEQLGHARNFSQMMHGAALLYNLILAEQAPGRDHTEHYREQLTLWWHQRHARYDELSAWDRDGFWNLLTRIGAHIGERTRQFVSHWLDLATDANAIAEVMDGPEGRSLVTQREHYLKRSRVRIGNPRALENWSGASGASQIDYRWNRPVRAIVNDILKPLTRGTNNA